MNIALSRLPLIGESWSLVRSERARPYLALTFFIDMALVFVFLVAIQSYLAEQYGGGTALAGYSLAAYGTAKLSGQLLAGRLIDRVGARRGMFVGLALVATGACALILAVLEPVAVLPAAAVYGLGGAAVWPAAYSLAAGEFKTEERARLTASLTVTTGLALACGLGLGFLLPSNFPYPAATALALIPIGGAAFTARAFPSDPSLHLPADGSGEPSGVRVAVRNLLTPKRIAHSAIVLIQAAMVGVMLAIFRSYGRDFIGVSFREELLLLAPAAAAGAGAVVLGGALSDRFGRIGVLGTGFLIAGLAIWGLSGVSSPAAVVPLAIVAALGIGLAVPSISALSIDLSRTAVTGTILAWFLTMEGLGQAAGPALGAWLNKAGGTTTVLWLVGGMSIAVALIALVPPFWHFPERPTPAKQAHRLVAGGLKGALVLGVAFPVAAVYLAYMPSSQVYGHMISHGPRERMEVALTFDDGPNDPWTLRIADTLESNDVKGTFFVIGQNADRNPQIVRTLVQRGHLIGNHSYHHRKRDAVLDLNYSELDKAESAISAAAGVCPALYRPPNGFHTPWQLDAVSNRKMQTVTWDVIPRDWKSPPPDVIVKRVMDSVKPGSIILLHDGDNTNATTDRSATLAALPGIIQGLKDRGYDIVRLDKLLSVQPYLPGCTALAAKS